MVYKWGIPIKHLPALLEEDFGLAHRLPRPPAQAKVGILRLSDQLLKTLNFHNRNADVTSTSVTDIMNMS